MNALLRRFRPYAPAAGLLLGTLYLAYLCGRQTWPGLGPRSFWLDDLWVAVLVKVGTFRQVVRLGPPTPLGFLALLRAVAHFRGTGETSLQLVAWIGRLLAVVALGWVVFGLTGRWIAGLAASVVLCSDQELASQSIRVKQYTLDALTTVLLLGGAVWWLRRPGLARWALMAAASILFLFVSFTSAFVGPAIVSLVGVSLVLRDRSHRWRNLLCLVLYDALVIGLCMALRRQASDQMVDDWRNNFLPRDHPKWAELWDFFANGPGWKFLTSAFPNGLTWPVWLIPIGLVSLVRRRETRIVGLFIIAFLLEMLVVNFYRLYPVGESRLDLFTHPLLLTAAAAGLAVLIVPIPPWGEAAMAVALLLNARIALADKIEYVDAGEHRILSLANARVHDTDSLVVYPLANWAVAYYGRWPSDLVAAPETTNRFIAVPERPLTLVLHEKFKGKVFKDSQEALDDQVKPFIAGAGKRVAYLGSHGRKEDHDRVLDAIKKAGFHEVERTEDVSACLAILERN